MSDVLAPDALAVSCDEEIESHSGAIGRCGALVGEPCVRWESIPTDPGYSMWRAVPRAPHPTRIARAREQSATRRTPTQTAGYIVTLSQVRRGLEDLLHAAERNPQLVADQLAAIRNCPHAIAAMGRALAHGEREGGEAGSNRGQTAQNHAEHAMSHGATAYGRPEERDAVTGELDATHAAARWALFVEVQR